jgi:CRISPR/Cas system-associated exonuclease Cas4 (RecB family)
MIVEKVIESKSRKIRQAPVHSNRASQLGHECVRYHVFERTRWGEKSLHDVYLQMIFDMGQEVENIVLKELREAGFQVNESQRAFSWPEYKITGSIDGMLILDGEAIPLEIKSSSPYAFTSINTVDDIKHHKYPYMRRYLSQVTLYCLLSNKEKAVILFKNKVSGALKEIWVPLDYSLGETLLKRAEEINKHVDDHTIPEPIEYDEMLCGDCAYQHICLPERTGREFQIMERPELVEWLTRMDELKPLVSEYNEIDGQVKKVLEGVEKAIIGDYVITGKWIERKPYEVKGGKYWSRKIQRV